MMNKRRVVIGIVSVFLVLAGGIAVWRVIDQRRLAAAVAGTPSEGVDLASTAAVLKAARTYVGEQELGKAEAVLRRALKDRPGDALMRELLGDVLLQGEDKPGAMSQYAELADRADASGEVLFKAGSLAGGMGAYERAIGYLTRATAAEPGSVEAAVQLANAQLESNRLDEAKAELTRAVVLDEGAGMAWGMLAEIAVRENRLEMASQHIVKARRFEPGSIPWRVLEARISRRRGEPEKSVMLLDGLRGESRFETSVVAEMAAALGMLGRSDDAMTIYRVAVRERPADGELRYQAAVWAERLGEAAEARELAQSAAMLGEARARDLLDRLGDD